MSDTATNEAGAATPGIEPSTATPPAPPAPTLPSPAAAAAPAPAAPPAAPDHGFSLDGDAPRLGDTPTRAPAPEERHNPLDSPAMNVPAPEGGPALPMVSPVLTSPGATQAPDQTTMPTLPSPVQPEPTAVGGDDDEDDTDSEPRHPMAHLMPAKSKPSEAQKRAAEQRAVKKAKARKIKLGVAAGFLVFAVVVGPPLFKWLSNALNEAGDTSTEEPAE